MLFRSPHRLRTDLDHVQNRIRLHRNQRQQHHGACADGYLQRADGTHPVVEAAAEIAGDQLRILAVTVLTSMSQQDLDDSGMSTPLDELVPRRAGIAIAAGANGVVASGHEAAALRESLGGDALIVTPGIRPSFAAGTQDQARVMTPRAAFERGASHIVVGRPIIAAADPFGAAKGILRDLTGTE